MLAACASTTPPTASLQAAQAAISNAERADASRYAAGELGEARTKLASADTAVREERMIAAEQQYNSGLVDFQVVLETQRALLSTQEGVALARADLSADHVFLYKALGGGWEGEDSDATRKAIIATPQPGAS
jgi:outer membrane protein TolC